MRRYKCESCNSGFQLPIDSIDEPFVIAANPLVTTLNISDEIFTESLEDVAPSFVRDENWFKGRLTNTTFVISSVQSNVPIDERFWKTLQYYAYTKVAPIFLLPIRHSTGAGSTKVHVYDPSVHVDLVDNNFKIHDKLKVLGALKINATTENPLTGLTAISKGDSVIVGHNQLQMMTLPVNQDDCPVIMTSTGTISQREYSQTKQGYKAEFNHSNSAVVVEIDGDHFHIRHLNWDGEGFYDIGTYYYSTADGGVGHNNWETIEALVTGDEHAIFIDPLVKGATYTNVDSIVNVLKPSKIVRHDLLDCYSVSHHHQKDVFTQYAKYMSGMNKIEDELEATIEHVIETTPQGVENLIVASNHNDHLTRWLNECDPKLEPWNAEIYHFLMYLMLHETKFGEAGAVYPNPFELYADKSFAANGVAVKFLGRREIYKILEVEIANHGDRGANGSRGSRKQFAQLPSKTIIGHSHSPGIEKGCYQVGTSSRLNLEYNAGPSSWMNTHCIIHKNGKRQLINIINGKWRR